MDEKERQAGSGQRIDKWLFFTRIVKSRTLAQKLVGSNHVRVNGTLVSQPSFQLRPGDRLEVSLGRRDISLQVKAVGLRRGPFEEARLLYDDLTPVDPRKALTVFEQAQRPPGSGRPTKRERRQIERLIWPHDQG